MRFGCTEGINLSQIVIPASESSVVGQFVIITPREKNEKVLLATTALTLSAGFASADVSISGSAEAGIHITMQALITLTLAGIDMNFAVSGASEMACLSQQQLTWDQEVSLDRI